MVKEQVANQYKFPGCAIGYDGLGIVNLPAFNDVRDHYAVSANWNQLVKVLMFLRLFHNARLLFNQDHLKDFVGKSKWNDDLLTLFRSWYQKILKE